MKLVIASMKFIICKKLILFRKTMSDVFKENPEILKMGPISTNNVKLTLNKKVFPACSESPGKDKNL
jgi:hypothetical protein